MSFESRPRSSAGTIAALRSDLYAGRLSRALGGEGLLASLYGGYAHDDATPGGGATATTASATYGGSGHLKLPSDWSLFGDLATVRHRTIPGLDPGRSRTAVRGELKGAVAGLAARGEAVRFQPHPATPPHPDAVFDRK